MSETRTRTHSRDTADTNVGRRYSEWTVHHKHKQYYLLVLVVTEGLAHAFNEPSLLTGLLLRGTIGTVFSAYRSRVTYVSPHTPHPNRGIPDERQRSLASTSPIPRLSKGLLMSGSHI